LGSWSVIRNKELVDAVWPHSCRSLRLGRPWRARYEVWWSERSRSDLNKQLHTSATSNMDKYGGTMYKWRNKWRMSLLDVTCKSSTNIVILQSLPNPSDFSGLITFMHSKHLIESDFSVPLNSADLWRFPAEVSNVCLVRSINKWLSEPFESTVDWW